MPQNCIKIVLSSVKDASESKHFASNFHTPHQIFKHNHNERQLGSLFGSKTRVGIKSIVEF